MPIAKLKPVESLAKYEEYLMKDKGQTIEHSSPEGLSESMTSAIEDEHARHKNKRVDHLAFTIYQSWPEEESGKFSIEKYNQMGRELAERWAPGHLAWVTTHTDTKCTHNHITICSVHTETGKALQRWGTHFDRMHETNNEIAKENGLSLNLPRTKDLMAKMSDKARHLVTKGKQSWVYDMVQKIDCARSMSTSFDEYVGQLSILGVGARVENKNISYQYGDKKPMRGKNLGTSFDKDGLMKAFKENDEKFAKHTGLREQLRSDVGAAFKGKGNPLGTQSDLLLESASHPGLGKKDYSRFTKVSRDDHGSKLPAIFDERGGLLYQEMKKAKQKSILEYCEENKIKTKLNNKGQTVLHGKEFIVLGKSEWTNTKNNTKGSVIEFVAIHNETSYLRAVAKLNGNPKLLLLEKALGDYKRTYQPFSVPKAKDAASPQQAKSALDKLMHSRGYTQKESDLIQKSNRVHVHKDGAVWLIGEKNESALELRPEKNDEWSSKLHGKQSSSFAEVIKPGKQLALYRNPFDFLIGSAKPKAAQKDLSHFVMLDAFSEKRLTEVLALNPHIQEVHVVESSNPKERAQEKDFAQKMKEQFNPFDILIKAISPTDIGRSHSRGHDIGM